MRRTLAAILIAMVVGVPSALAQSTKVKIGFVNTFSGPNAFIGNDERDGFELALDHLGRQMGGLPVETFYEDDQMKPDVGRQVTDKLIQVHKVDFITGFNWSNVLLASLKPATDSKTFLISGNAGPSQIAGELCSPYFFSASWQNDQTPMALGETLNQRGIKRLYILAPNYAAGKDMASGVKHTFKGEIVGEDYTRWPDNLDFSAELSKVRTVKPDAVWIFYPGRAGVQFFQQYAQAGLNEQIPLYSVFTVDALTLPLIKDLALGHLSTQSWVQDLDNPANKRFVADFYKKYRRYPSYYSAQHYDAAMLIASAVNQTKGTLSDKTAVQKALERADFKSVRGAFKFGNNHIPIQDFYVQEVVKNERGELVFKTIATAVKNSQDRYHTKCPMK